MDLAFWLMTQQAQRTSGSAIEVGQHLSVKSTRSEFDDVPFYVIEFFIVLFQNALLVVRFTDTSSLTQ